VTIPTELITTIEVRLIPNKRKKIKSSPISPRNLLKYAKNIGPKNIDREAEITVLYGSQKSVYLNGILGTKDDSV
jgi:hypothetical protein